MIKLEKILIQFNDNDFWLTWVNVLNTLAEAIKQGFKTESKESLLKVLNNMSYSHYLLFQNKCEYTHDEEYLKKYLTIKNPEHILLNCEVEEFLYKTNSYNNKAYYLLIYGDEFQVGNI